MNKYILDTNVLISAFRIKYPMDVMPTFWILLLGAAEKGVCLLIDSVKKEILEGGDELSKWLQSNSNKITTLTSDDPMVIDSYSQIVQDITDDTQYSISAKNEFASKADSWIIAHAHAHKYILVTEEVYNRDIKRKVPIPNVCLKYGLTCMNTISFLREIGLKI